MITAPPVSCHFQRCMLVSAEYPFGLTTQPQAFENIDAQGVSRFLVLEPVQFFESPLVPVVVPEAGVVIAPPTVAAVASLP